MADLTNPDTNFFEGLTVQEMVDETLGLLGAAPGDYNRYDLAAVIRALNLGALRFAKLTSCLVMPAILICKAQQQNYRLPFGVLRVINARYYTGAGSTDYFELKILKDSRAMQMRDAEYRGTAGPPDYLFPTYKAGAILYVGVSPIPDQDGATFNADPRYGKITSATDVTILGKLTGTALYAGADLTDTDGRDFLALGVAPGMQVFNITQGKNGVITAITTAEWPNDNLVATLSGGATWAIGDAFEVPVNEYGVMVDSDGLTTMLPSYLGAIGDIVPQELNISMDVARKPALLTSDNLLVSSEIPSHYQEAVIGYATYRLGSRMFKGVVQGDKAAAGLTQFNALVMEYNADHDFVEESEAEIEVMDYWNGPGM